MGWAASQPVPGNPRLDGVTLGCGLKEGAGPKIRLRLGAPQVERLGWSAGLRLVLMVGTEADTGKIRLLPAGAAGDHKLHRAGSGLGLAFAAARLPRGPRGAHPARHVRYRMLSGGVLEVTLPAWAAGGAPVGGGSAPVAGGDS